MSKMLYLKGQRFGIITVLECVGADYCNNKIWKCICDCGKVFIRSASAINNPGNVSCGCVKRKKASERAKKRNEIQFFGTSNLP